MAKPKPSEPTTTPECRIHSSPIFTESYIDTFAYIIEPFPILQPSPIKTPGINTTSSSITAFFDTVTKFPIDAVSEIIAISSMTARLEIPVSIAGFSLKSSVHLA